MKSKIIHILSIAAIILGVSSIGLHAYAADFSDDVPMTDTFTSGIENTTVFAAEEPQPEEQTIRDGIIYKLDSTYNTYTVIGYTEDLVDKKEITIPEFINNITISSLETNCFHGLKNITAIYLPGTVHIINNDIFDSWDGITINCPAGSRPSSYAIFYGIAQDNSFYPPEAIDYAERGYYEYDHRTKTYTAYLAVRQVPDPTNVVYLSEIAGYPVATIKHLKRSLTFLEETGWNYNGIRSVTIPASVLDLDMGTFSPWDFCAEDAIYPYQDLTTVTFAEGDTPLVMGTQQFEICHSLTTVNFSSRIRELPEQAFIDCPALKRLELPVKMTAIGAAALQGAKNMEALHIPSTVTTIADDAVDGLASLTIFGQSGSYAQTFASAHGIAFRELADGASMPEVIVGRAAVDPASFQLGEDKLTAALLETVTNADGYDFVISQDSACTVNKTYLQIRKNQARPSATFKLAGFSDGTYYMFCHAWKKVNGEKVFGPWSELQSVQITQRALKKASPPVLKSVKVTGRTVTVTLTASSFAQGSDCILGKSKNSCRPLDTAYVRKNQKTRTITFSHVKKGTYYVGSHSYVYVNGLKNFSDWSNLKKITVK